MKLSLWKFSIEINCNERIIISHSRQPARHKVLSVLNNKTINIILNCRSWYAYVIELCFGAVHSSIEAFFLLIFYHISLFFLLWSYYKTIFTKIALVPPLFKVSRTEMDQLINMRSPDEQSRFLKNLSKDLPIVNCTINNCVRFCEKCQVKDV